MFSFSSKHFNRIFSPLIKCQVIIWLWVELVPQISKVRQKDIVAWVVLPRSCGFNSMPSDKPSSKNDAEKLSNNTINLVYLYRITDL